MLSESDFDKLLSHLQKCAEQAPPDERARRRLIMRGMGAAYSVMIDDLSPIAALDELFFELTGRLRQKPSRKGT